MHFAYVPIVYRDPGFVVARGSVDALRSRVQQSRYAEAWDMNKYGDVGLRFTPTHDDVFEDTALIELLLYLNRLGVLFGEDDKQYYSPAAYMRELQKGGRISTSFKSVAWRGPGQPVILLHGWPLSTDSWDDGASGSQRDC